MLLLFFFLFYHRIEKMKLLIKNIFRGFLIFRPVDQILLIFLFQNSIRKFYEYIFNQLDLY